MRTQPLGPSGVQQRMQEIQSQLDSVFGEKFNSALQGAMDVSGAFGEQGLSGTIGDPNDVRPLNPFGGGMQIDSAAPEQIKSMIREVAGEVGVDPVLFESLVSAESGFNPRAVSSAGAKGLTQLMDGTAREVGVSDPFDPMQNLRGGAKYLSKMISKFKDVRLALAAYNAGPGRVEQAGGVPNIPETRAYVDKIMTMYHARRGR